MTPTERPSDPGLHRIAGHPVAVRRLGSGPRPLLALHCSLAHGGAWAPLAQLMPERVVIAPDLPGHGQSAPPGEADFHALSTGIAAELAAEIGAGVPVDLIGHSFGGTVALRLALEHPGLVRSLTLVEPVLFAAARGTARFTQNFTEQARIAALVATDSMAAAAEFHAEWGGGMPFAALPERQCRYMAERMYLVTGPGPVLMEDAAGLLAPGRLEALDIPVLLAEGCESPGVVRVINDGLADRIPGANRLRVDGAGHMLPITHPQPLADTLHALLAAG
ncbi:alpha/beta fold hydrolase [Pseudogemmobacter bohemicus]|uniref:alpha/beta fold hydrolase n=1 Tax=Pseudogemmobacter bohemicus TaxID=2250708 RepID=UPI000DD4B56B|nr:alpha/beta fold hydrolase [Pseudogemmobacter bohemicus]